MSTTQEIVLITGANSGVGYATAKIIGLESPSYHVILAGRNMDKLNKAVEELKSTSGMKATFSTLQLDVTDRASIARAAGDTEKQFGHVDAFFNNAGVYKADGTLEEQLRYTFEANVIGASLTAEAFTPLLLKSKSPYMINVSSALGILAFRRDPEFQALAYRQSKAALNHLTQYQVDVYGPKGLKAFSACPGLVVSNLRGTGEVQRSAGGAAIDADTSGRFFLNLIQGKRDADVGKFVHEGGLYPW